MSIGNVEPVHKCGPQHLHMRTARIKEYKDTDEEGKKKRRVIM